MTASGESGEAGIPLIPPTSPSGPIPPYAVEGDPRHEAFRAVLAEADRLGVPVLMGGGVVYVQHGLISPRVSRALSLIVDPVGYSSLLVTLGGSGWVPARSTSRSFLPVAVTSLWHVPSNAYLDLYPIIPGFLRHPVSVFETLWRDRVAMRAFGRDVWALDRLAMMMLAVHSRLGPRSGGSRLEEFRDFFFQQFAVVITRDERARLPALTRAVGGEGVMRPFFDQLGIPCPPARVASVAYARARFGIDDVTSGARLLIGGWDSAARPRPRLARDARLARRRVLWAGPAHAIALARILPAAAVRRRRDLLRLLGISDRTAPRSAAQGLLAASQPIAQRGEAAKLVGVEGAADAASDRLSVDDGDALEEFEPRGSQ